LIIGSTISHHEIVEKLGDGGSGVVNQAEHIQPERTVSLKFSAQHLLYGEVAKERSLREAKANAALRHLIIFPVHEMDEGRHHPPCQSKSL
jgi:serine/threonine protein kinase